MILMIKMDVLFIDPMLQSMGILSEGLDLVLQHSNGRPLAFLIILLGRGWHPLLLLLRQHDLDLLRSSTNTIYGQARHDRLVFSTCDVSKLVGLHPG